MQTCPTQLPSGFTSGVPVPPCVLPPELLSAWRGRVLIDRYRLGDPVGVGGTGVVFAADDLLEREPVAVKLLMPRPHLPPDTARLRLEEEIAAHHLHPNLVRVRRVGENGCGTAFVVMDLLEGLTLAQLLKVRRALDVPTTVALLLPILDALSHVHERGILHRDIKPENLFLAKSGDGPGLIPKLLDFGIAKRMSCASHTGSGFVLGTPAYMSPEQALAEPLTLATDIWSLGVVLFRCLSGQLPFEASSSTGLLLKVVSTNPPKLSDVAPSVPSEVAAVVDWALRRGPAQRPPSTNALGRALKVAADATLQRNARLRLLPSREEEKMSGHEASHATLVRRTHSFASDT